MPILSVPYRQEYGLAVVKLWRQAFQRAMGLPEQNALAELSGHLDFFISLDPANHHILMESDTSTIVAFMSLSPGSLDHLYVHVDWQGQGLGGQLLDRAKSLSGDGLELYTFARNTGAQHFYLSRGFKEVARGYASSGDNPWATSPDELADIRYRWEPIPH